MQFTLTKIFDISKTL